MPPRDRSSDMMSARNFSRSPQGQNIVQSNLSQGDTLKLLSKAVSIPGGGITSGAGLAGGKSEILSYPTNDVNNYPARMRFTVHKIKSYQVDAKATQNMFDKALKKLNASAKDTVEFLESFDSRKNREGTGSGFDGVDDFGNNPNPDTAVVGGDTRKLGLSPGALGGRIAESEFQIDAAAGSVAQKATNLKTFRSQEAPIIYLHLPPGLVYQDGVNYNPVDIGPGGLTALGVANNGGALLSALNQAVFSGITNMFDLVTGALEQEAAQVAAARAVNRFVPGQGAKAALQTATQTGINTGTRAIFDRPNIRNFTFQFKLIATSAPEALQIEKIIKSFRSELYPESIDIGGGLPIGYKFPNIYKIDFNFNNGSLKVPKILLCYLRDMTTTVNGTAAVFHYDGQPSEIDLTLIFQEYRALSRQDVEAGF